MNRFIGILFFVFTIIASSSNAFSDAGNEMIVRISEIEIEQEYLEEYKAILKEEAEASVRLEPGVIAIFPMFQIESPVQVRILEIYSNRAAYESHLKTPHFIKYKNTTMKMVKSLKLIDMQIIDLETMEKTFEKMTGGD